MMKLMMNVQIVKIMKTIKLNVNNKINKNNKKKLKMIYVYLRFKIVFNVINIIKRYVVNVLKIFYYPIKNVVIYKNNIMIILDAKNYNKLIVQNVLVDIIY